MPDGLPCWNCSSPIPPERHRLNTMERVFCSGTCRDAFTELLQTQPSGLCSAHQYGEDPWCRICYPQAREVPHD